MPGTVAEVVAAATVEGMTTTPAHPDRFDRRTVAGWLAVWLAAGSVLDAATTWVGLTRWPEVIVEANPAMDAVMTVAGPGPTMAARATAGVSVAVVLWRVGTVGWLVRPSSRDGWQERAGARRRSATVICGAGAVITWTVAMMNVGIVRVVAAATGGG